MLWVVGLPAGAEQQPQECNSHSHGLVVCVLPPGAQQQPARGCHGVLRAVCCGGVSVPIAQARHRRLGNCSDAQHRHPHHGPDALLWFCRPRPATVKSPAARWSNRTMSSTQREVGRAELHRSPVTATRPAKRYLSIQSRGSSVGRGMVGPPRCASRSAVWTAPPSWRPEFQPIFCRVGADCW